MEVVSVFSVSVLDVILRHPGGRLILEPPTLLIRHRSFM
jgi:hypothetical protein